MARSEDKKLKALERKRDWIFQSFEKCLHPAAAPDAVAVTARKVVEAICLRVHEDVIGSTKDLALAKVISALRKESAMPAEALAALDAVRILGNYGGHPERDGRDSTPEHAAIAVISALSVARWFVEEYCRDLVPRDGARLPTAAEVAESVLGSASLPPYARSAESLTPATRAALLETGRVIKLLTDEQAKALEGVRHTPRVLIRGCAGSGKTILAADVARRFDQAGLRSLVLCHNPLLASYLRKLLSRSGVQVQDFLSWFDDLLGADHARPPGWTYWHEPAEADIRLAREAAAARLQKLDAIVIDEAQDFRDSWWPVIEAALADPVAGKLVLFSDDHQALSPRLESYPRHDALLTLSRNCRNAGRIFELVRRVHPQAPGVSAFLERQGVADVRMFRNGEERVVTQGAILDALRVANLSQVVVLTTEDDPVECAFLSGFEFLVPEEPSWQQLVAKHLGRVTRNLPVRKDVGKGTIEALGLPALSDAEVPTQSDIEAVSRLATHALSCLYPGSLHALASTRYRGRPPAWQREGRTLSLTLPGDVETSPRPLLQFFSTREWADGLATRTRIRLAPRGQAETSPELEHLPLHTVQGFKGLESDCVVLFVRGMRANLETALYVAISRARLALYVVCDTRTYSLFR